MHCDAVIIGAGPYGLAAAAHLRTVKGLDVRVFGEPMEFWSRHMPQGMLLRSAWSASSIADPQAELTLDAYKHFSGNHLCAPVSLERFIDYGLWFQHAIVPDVCPTKVSRIEQNHCGFQLTLCDGQKIKATRVIVAAGIHAFAAKPKEFTNIPKSLASHTCEAQDLNPFSGKRVAVIGGGQSALESAALLNETGAQVEVLVRSPRVHWLGWKERIQKLGPLSRALLSREDVGPAAFCRVVASPFLLRKLPRGTQDALRRLSLRPAGARWLIDRLKQVRITTGITVGAATMQGGSLKLNLSDGTARIVDHAMLGTGYRPDVARYPFLGTEVSSLVQTVDGFPKLNSIFESSLPGLHFLGAAAAWSFGPLMYFVSGTSYAAATLRQCFTKKMAGSR